MQSHLSPICVILALAACTTATGQAEAPACRTVECVAIGQGQQLARGLTVTPLEVLEDSRCPVEADCVWEGRVRIRAQFDLGHESFEAQLDSSAPLRIHGGFLSIAEIAPDMSRARMPIPPQDYRFGFSFAPDMMTEHG